MMLGNSKGRSTSLFLPIVSAPCNSWQDSFGLSSGRDLEQVNVVWNQEPYISDDRMTNPARVKDDIQWLM